MLICIINNICLLKISVWIRNFGSTVRN